MDKKHEQVLVSGPALAACFHAWELGQVAAGIEARRVLYGGDPHLKVAVDKDALDLWLSAGLAPDLQAPNFDAVSSAALDVHTQNHAQTHGRRGDPDIRVMVNGTAIREYVNAWGLREPVRVRAAYAKLYTGEPQELVAVERTALRTLLGTGGETNASGSAFAPTTPAEESAVSLGVQGASQTHGWGYYPECLVLVDGEALGSYINAWMGREPDAAMQEAHRALFAGDAHLTVPVTNGDLDLLLSAGDFALSEPDVVAGWQAAARLSGEVARATRGPDADVLVMVNATALGDVRKAGDATAAQAARGRLFTGEPEQLVPVTKAQLREALSGGDRSIRHVGVDVVKSAAAHLVGGRGTSKFAAISTSGGSPQLPSR